MGEPLYFSIYTNLKNKILSKEYALQEVLPNEKELAEHYDVSTITIKKAMQLLKEDGLIIRKPRKGTIVVSQSLSTKTQAEGLNDTPTPVFGLIITNFTDFFGSQILRTIINQPKIDFIVRISYGNNKLEDEIIEEMLSIGINGLIILPSSSEYISPILLELTSRDFPIVVIDRLMDKLPICSVKTDSLSAAKDLTAYLINHGHKRIGLITSSSHVTTIDERISGFIAAHLDRDLRINQSQILSAIDSVIPDSKTPVENDIERIIRFLKENPDLTAISTTEYNIALLAKSAISRLGLRIPDDVSLVCFDHPALNIFDTESDIITHVEQNQTMIGENAIQLLLQKKADPTFIEKQSLSYKIIEGNSVRKIE